MTREKLTKTYNKCHYLKTIINSYLEKNPHMRKDVYKKYIIAKYSDEVVDDGKHDYYDLSYMSECNLIEVVKKLTPKLLDRIESESSIYGSRFMDLDLFIMYVDMEH